MINCSLLKLLFAWDLHDKLMSGNFSLMFLDIAKWDCAIKTI